jgi:hypothetical protein
MSRPRRAGGPPILDGPGRGRQGPAVLYGEGVTFADETGGVLGRNGNVLKVTGLDDAGMAVRDSEKGIAGRITWQSLTAKVGSDPPGVPCAGTIAGLQGSERAGSIMAMPSGSKGVDANSASQPTRGTKTGPSLCRPLYTRRSSTAPPNSVHARRYGARFAGTHRSAAADTAAGGRRALPRSAPPGRAARSGRNGCSRP